MMEWKLCSQSTDQGECLSSCYHWWTVNTNNYISKNKYGLKARIVTYFKTIISNSTIDTLYIQHHHYEISVSLLSFGTHVFINTLKTFTLISKYYNSVKFETFQSEHYWYTNTVEIWFVHVRRPQPFLATIQNQLHNTHRVWKPIFITIII